MRPLTGRKRVAELAYRVGIIQDVYDLEDDTITQVQRTDHDCGGCQACVDACPTELPLESIGVVHDPDQCINCLYCWWRCDDGGIELVGKGNFMDRQLNRYKGQVENL
jgi:ferredoxin